MDKEGEEVPSYTLQNEKLLCPWAHFKAHKGTPPGPREGHSATTHGNEIFIYGGVTEAGQYSQELHILNVESREWIRGPDGPRAKAFHRAVLYKNQILIVGGTSFVTSVSLLVYDIELQSWSIMEIEGALPHVFFHSATLVEDKILVWGGTGGGYFYLSTSKVWIVDLEKKTVRQYMFKSAEIPARRANHSAVLYDGHIYVFGGFFMESTEERGQSRVYRSDLWTLDISSFEWKELTIEGTQPSGRSGHSACFFPQAFGVTQSMLIFGGRTMSGDIAYSLNETWSFDLKNHEWCHHIVAENENVVSHDLYAPEDVTKKSKIVEVMYTRVPVPRRNHAGARLGTKLFIFGGWSGKERFGATLSDTRVLETNQVILQESTYSQDMKTAMEKLMNDRNFSDVSFVVGAKRFYVNKAIVAARCPQLNAMFSGKWKESSQSDVVVELCNEQVFEELLRYKYCDEVNLTEDVALDLLHAADAFMLSHLKIQCEYFIAHALETTNVLDVLKIAHRFHAALLKSACINFIIVRWAQYAEQVGTLPEDLREELTRLQLCL